MSFTRNLKLKMRKEWEYGYQHPFLQELGKGILNRKAFQFYLIQDYFYLLQYAKVFALGALKAREEEILLKFTTVQYTTLQQEISLHKEYMKQFHISKERLQTVEVALLNKAYTSNMLSVAQEGGIADILATTFPCAWTYGEYAKRLKEQYKDLLENNPYRKWMEMYASEEFEKSYQWFFEALDYQMIGKNQEEQRRIEGIFRDSLCFENLFWDISYRQERRF